MGNQQKVKLSALSGCESFQSGFLFQGLIWAGFCPEAGLISHDVLANLQNFLHQTRWNTMLLSQLDVHCFISLQK